jgi:hypothetical protein
LASGILLVLFFILIIAASVYLLFIIPLGLTIILERREGVTSLHAGISWFIISWCVEYREGLGNLDLILARKRVWRWPLSARPGAAEPEQEWNMESVSDIARNVNGIRDDLMRIARTVIRYTRLRRLSCDIRFGLSNPADTGMLFGWYAAIQPVILQNGRISCSVTPVFDRVLLDGSCRCDLRISRPLVIPILVIHLFLKHRDQYPENPVTRDRVGARV